MYSKEEAEEEEGEERQVREQRSCTVGVVSVLHRIIVGKKSFTIGTVGSRNFRKKTSERFAVVTQTILCWRSTHLQREEALQSFYCQWQVGIPHNRYSWRSIWVASNIHVSCSRLRCEVVGGSSTSSPRLLAETSTDIQGCQFEANRMPKPKDTRTVLFRATHWISKQLALLTY